MPKVIEQTVKFSATAAELYELYMDEVQHAEATKAPAKISRDIGGSFTCHKGHITGRNLELVPGKLIVQTWRANFPAGALDSILVLAFRDVEGGAELHMTHANVPDARVEQLTSGWHKAYWDPWQAYLQQR